jgi:L-fuconolactonase
MPLPLVDAHLHLWDPARLEYPWLAGIPQLHRRFGPADLDTGGHLLTGVVFIEAGRRDDQALAEVAWVEQLAAHWPVLQAVVAHAPLERGERCRRQLAELSRHRLVTGIRRNLQDEPAGFALAGDFVAGVRLLAGFGFSFDLCVRHRQLPEVTELVAAVPEVTFVLDHLGKPPVASGQLDPWREDLSRLAGHPNVVCKLSGLATEADHQRWQVADVLPYLACALAEFGPERCLVGGDWPVATLATSYQRWLDTVAGAISGLADEQQRAVLAGTATRVYRLAGRSYE